MSRRTLHSRRADRARPEQRGIVRRLLDVWGFVPDIAAPHDDVRLVTRDDVTIVGSYLPGPATTASPAEVPAVVLAHGFAGHRRKPAYAMLAERLADDAAVLTLDLRGHGDSRGRSTLGDREALDVRAGAAWLRERGHRWTAAIGVSMGATAALRAAGGGPPEAFDAVCAISGPAEFIRDDTPAVRALARTMTSTTWRIMAELAYRVRIAREWGDPADAVALVENVAPTPLLLVHGADDHFFSPEHADRLFARAREPKRLWHEPAGFGHAEDGLTPAFVERLATALKVVRQEGRWPDTNRS